MEKGERKMAKGDLFSTVLRGFHKEQVSQYLNDLIRKYEREKEELNQKYAGINPDTVNDLRRENEELRRALEQEKARAAESEKQREEMPGEADLERLKVLTGQIKSRMEEARRMEQQARRESERIIAAARIEGQTILNKAKEAGSEGISALGRRRRELDQEAERISKEKSDAHDLTAQAMKNADEIRAAACRERETILEDARAQAQQILQEAREESAKILRQAQEEKTLQMDQMREETAAVKSKLNGMAYRLTNLSQELKRFDDLMAQQNADVSGKRKQP